MSPLGTPAALAFGGKSPYSIGQSLRFNSADSAYLNRTPGSAGNRQRFTISFWIKRGTLGTTELFTGKGVAGFLSTLLSAGELYLFDNGAASGGFQIWSQRVLRDPSSWYHIVIAVDTTQATDSNRIKVYINGDQENLATWNVGAGASRYPALNSNFDWNNTDSHKIGNNPNGYFDGYFAEFYNIDGSQLTPSSFGETDTTTGTWIPKRYSGSYTGNSFYLKFQSSGIGTDSSGLSNTWTANNFSTSGTGTDVMSDTPTTNWCTFSPINKLGATLSDGNLTVNGTSNCFQSTIMVNSGKYYFEFTKNANGDNQFGIAYGGAVPTTDAFRRAWRDNNGSPQWLTDNATAGSGTPQSCAVNDVIGVALDMDNNAVYFSKNGTFMNSGDPTSGSSKTGAIWTDLAGQSWGPNAGANANGCYCTLNCGQRAFSFTPPTGYKALNTANLPEPTIKKGGKYFDAKLVTTTGSSQNVTGLNFQPDLVWQKSRNDTYSHILEDAVRGAGKRLSSDQTVVEDSLGVITSFNTDGFTSNYSGWGTAPKNWVAWCWDAGGTGSTNTAGSRTSTVSANASAGFSIVTYTGNSTAGATVGHGLGVAPSMIITKARGATSEWGVYHSALGGTKALLLNQAYDQQTNVLYWNNTNPSSTVFTLGGGSTTNNTTTYVAYCFSEVAGYSKFGSYVGNGSTTDGPFIWCGFTPRWILIKWYKDVSTAESWHIYDTARQTYNATNRILQPDSSGIEETPSDRYIDILSNGFKLRQNGQQINRSGASYIFAAFAKLPFKYSTAR